MRGDIWPYLLLHGTHNMTCNLSLVVTEQDSKTQQLKKKPYKTSNIINNNNTTNNINKYEKN